MIERGLSIDHTTIYRWVQKFAPEIDKRSRSYLKQINDSWRVDETYVKVKGRWMYLYRAVDSTSKTLDFLLNQTRSTRAAKRFFRKLLGHSSITPPRVINVDKNRCYIGAVKDLKRRVSPGLGFGSFLTAWRTIQGYKTINMIRKGQIVGVEKGNIKAQNQFVANLFDLIG